MYALRGEMVSPKTLARRACEIELYNLHKPIGVQDQYIAALGGLRLIQFNTDKNITSRRLNLNAISMRKLNESLMLFYSGISRQADEILAEQKENIPRRLDILRQMRQMAFDAALELESGNVDSIGLLMDEAWKLKKSLASKISNGDIDAMYTSAKEAGALGGKITGAGGGGFFLIYCPHEHQDTVRTALKIFQELPFQLEHDGSKVIFNYHR
jgi:D-glycero-alpha-D-manno-heptose-7-phosphate kinase